MNKQTRALTIYLNRISAEECGKRRVCDDGAKVVRRRWRSKSGEFDLIFQLGSLFCLCRSQKSQGLRYRCGPDHKAPAWPYRGASEEFAAQSPQGLETGIRIDVALVNDTGACPIIENVSLSAHRFCALQCLQGWVTRSRTDLKGGLRCACCNSNGSNWINRYQR